MKKTIYEIYKVEKEIGGKFKKIQHFPKIGSSTNGISGVELELLYEIQEWYDPIFIGQDKEKMLMKLKEFKNSAIKSKKGFWKVTFYWLQSIELEFDDNLNEWICTNSSGNQWYADWE